MGNCLNKSSSSRRRSNNTRKLPEMRATTGFFNQDQQFNSQNGDVSVVLRNQPTTTANLGDHSQANLVSTFGDRYIQTTSNSIPNHHMKSLPNNYQNNTNNNINQQSNLNNQHHLHLHHNNNNNNNNYQHNNNAKLFIALYDYEARTPEDLRFQKGEYLEVIDDGNSGWWLAISQLTGERGYIPREYVARCNSIEAETWYFGRMRRVDADKRLMMPENQHGAFMIRDSESRANEFSLSVRDQNFVKHYRIRQADNGGFYITKKTPAFGSLQELVKHYSDDADGLCVNLRVPCVRIEKPVTNDLSHRTQDIWEIDRATLTFKDKLGSGQFGQVYEGVWNNVTPVAIKTLKEGSMDREDFLAEAQIMKELKHPNLIKLFAVCTQQEPILIVTEIMRNGCLLDYLKTPAGQALDLKILVTMAEQIARGMAFLESMKYVHRDLAARNILVGERNIVKVADFGLARLIKEDEYEARVGARFPIKWTAPEAATLHKFSTKSDVWSFGILLTELVTYGRVPYPGMTNSEVLQQVEKGMRMTKESLGPNCTDQLYAIMLECWHKDPHKRLTFEALQWKLDELFDTDSSEYRDAGGLMTHRS